MGNDMSTRTGSMEKNGCEKTSQLSLPTTTCVPKKLTASTSSLVGIIETDYQPSPPKDSELFTNNLNYGTFIGDIDCKQLKMVKKTMRKALSGNFEINDRPCRLMWTEKLITKVSADILCMATNEPHGYLGASVSVRLERPDARNPYQSLCSFRFDEHAPQMIEITLTLPVVEQYSLFSCSSISAVISSYVCCYCKSHQSFVLIGEAYLLVKEKRYIPYSSSPALSGN